MTKQIVFDLLVTHDGNKHIWIKKATGLGISEFMLLFMAWLCLKDDALAGSHMCIVTGPRIDLAIALMDRSYSRVAREDINSGKLNENVAPLPSLLFSAHILPP